MANAKKITRKPITTDTSETDSLINSVVAGINKVIKDENAQVTVGDDDTEYGKSVPYWVRTYIPQLDYAVGGMNHPGVPGGRIIEIFGGEGSGKSTTAVWLTNCAIRQLGTFAVYQDAENVLTDEIIKGTGLDMSRIILQNPETIEQVFQTQEATLEQLKESGTDRPVITVVDSVAACPTQAEIDADYGDSTMATQARALSTAMKKIKTDILEHKVMSIFTNQIRDKMNVSFGKSTTTPGGRALPFYASVRIELVRTSWINGKDASEKLGGVYQATVIKNKVAPPMKKAEFKIDFIEEDGYSYPRINIEDALLNWCKDHKLLDGGPGRVNLNGKSYYLKEAVNMLREDVDLFNEIVDLAYSVGINTDEDDE
jgi:recombination protein RecA